jgi:hypothetical protein
VVSLLRQLAPISIPEGLTDPLFGRAREHTLALVPRHVGICACTPDDCPSAGDGNDCPPASCR